MKIAFFHELTPLSGARKVVGEYGKIIGKGHIIDLFYVDSTEDKKAESVFNKVYFFEFKQKKYNGGDWKSRLYIDTIELIRLYFLHKKIANIIKINKYDFVFVNPSKFTQTPFLLKFIDRSVYFCQEPLRIVYEDFLEIPRNVSYVKKTYEEINRKIRKIIDKNNIKRANLVLANSLFSKNNIKKLYGINSHLCYLGVDPIKFRFLNIKKEYDGLFIGLKTNIEGYDLLENTLMLYKQKPKIKFVERNSEGRGINDESLIKDYNKSKIVLSLSRNEPFGLIPIEAMSCEVPVIAINEGGLRESVINAKTGFLINRKPKDLKDKIDLLLNDSSLRDRLGKAGRDRVLANFTWETSVNNFLNLLKKHL